MLNDWGIINIWVWKDLDVKESFIENKKFSGDTPLRNLPKGTFPSLTGKVFLCINTVRVI